MEVPAGIAPAYGGFADPCLTAWLRHPVRLSTVIPKNEGGRQHREECRSGKGRLSAFVLCRRIYTPLAHSDWPRPAAETNGSCSTFQKLTKGKRAYTFLSFWYVPFSVMKDILSPLQEVIEQHNTLLSLFPTEEKNPVKDALESIMAALHEDILRVAEAAQQKILNLNTDCRDMLLAALIRDKMKSSQPSLKAQKRGISPRSVAPATVPLAEHYPVAGATELEPRVKSEIMQLTDTLLEGKKFNSKQRNLVQLFVSQFIIQNDSGLPVDRAVAMNIMGTNAPRTYYSFIGWLRDTVKDTEYEVVPILERKRSRKVAGYTLRKKDNLS